MPVLCGEDFYLQNKIAAATAGIARSQFYWSTGTVHLVDKDLVGGEKQHILMQDPAKVYSAIKGLQLVLLPQIDLPFWRRRLHLSGNGKAQAEYKESLLPRPQSCLSGPSWLS